MEVALGQETATDNFKQLAKYKYTIRTKEKISLQNECYYGFFNTASDLSQSCHIFKIERGIQGKKKLLPQKKCFPALKRKELFLTRALGNIAINLSML